jgi:hypothetical protein
MTDEMENLESRLKQVQTEIKELKKRHGEELVPLLCQERAMQAQLGELYSGLTPGDIVTNDAGIFARVKWVAAEPGTPWRASTIVTEPKQHAGLHMKLLEYSGWRKVTVA